MLDRRTVLLDIKPALRVQQVVYLVNKIRIDIQKRSIEMTMELANTFIHRFHRFQFGIQFLKLTFACQTVQLFQSLFAVRYQLTAQFQESSYIFLFYTIALFHLRIHFPQNDWPASCSSQ